MIKSIRKITILGNDIRVKPTRAAAADGEWGRWFYETNTIELAPMGFDDGRKVVDNDVYGKTLFHEMFHATFDYLGRNELSKDEGLVEAMAVAWWQIFKQIGSKK